MKNNLVEYKERLKLEQQKNAQSNDFGFEDDDLATVHIELEALQKKMRMMEEEAKEWQGDKEQLNKEKEKLKKTLDQTNIQLAETRALLQELKGQYNKLEMTNEVLKQNGGGPGNGERAASVALKQFSELEKKYIQTKK